MLDKIECPCGLAGLTSNDIGCHLCVGMTPKITMQSTCHNMTLAVAVACDIKITTLTFDKIKST